MEMLGDRTWKTYYSLERERRREEMEVKARSLWELPDPEVDRVVARGGALSFPHTYLDGSFMPLFRAVRAVHRSGKAKVVALGVVHDPDKDPEMFEFSLDGLSFILVLVEESLGQDRIALTRQFITRDRNRTSIGDIVKDLEAKGRALRPMLDEDTVLMVTGDLLHYGHGYGTAAPSEDPSHFEGMVKGDLDLLYRKKDHIGYYQSARRNMNDQAVVGVTLSTALGAPLDYDIYSMEMTDYSDVLGKERPTLVASVFYGVHSV